VATPAQTPLQHYLRVQLPIDAQTRRILREAAAEAERIIKSYGRKGSFEKTRARQALRDLRQLTLDLFGEVDGVTRVGVKAAAKSAAISEKWFSLVLKKHFGDDIPNWERALGYSAENGITALLAKQKNAIPLSRKIYLARAFSNDQIGTVISRDLLLQKSARQIANDVKKLINPSGPGGV
jgi:hypothetical protein